MVSLARVQQLAPFVGLVPAMGDALPDHRPAGARGNFFEQLQAPRDRHRHAQRTARNLHGALIDLAERAGQFDNFFVGGEAALDRRAVGVHMHGILIGRETGGAGAHAGFEHFFHLLDFRRRRRAFEGSLAHDELAQRAVAHQRCDIDAEIAAHGVEILPKGGKPPLHPGLQSRKRDRLDALKASEDRVAIRFFTWRQRQAAVAGDHGSHAVIAGRSRQRVPKQVAHRGGCGNR